MTETLADIAKGLLVGAGVVSAIVEISPIKINPWTWLIRALGRALNHDMNAKVDKLSLDVKSLRSELGEREAVTARIRILRFGDDCRQGARHSKEYFDQIEADITTYERYCAEHPGFKNNMTSLTIAYINKIYARCLEKNDFL